jgi:pimeloyl-ACP methyl ester carboxylesterase
MNPQLDFALDGSMGGDPMYGSGIFKAGFVNVLGGYFPIFSYATSTMYETVIPANTSQTINHGDELWTMLVSSWASYGANHWVAGVGNMPFVQICDDACDAPIATTSPPCTQDCNSNVLFLPGIEASRLYDSEGGEKRLWEPDGDTNAMQLSLTQQGKSVRPDVYTKDVLDEAYITNAGPNVYKSFIASMNTLKSTGKINDWAPIPYDWRLSLEDILNGGNQTGGTISYLNATNTPYIEQTLRHLAATSRTGKVTIIAHSNGGLVVKALMLRLGASTTASLIDKVIFVAVPQIGTPAAVGALLHGYDQGIPFGRISDATMRTLGNHSPTAYNLLPSANYFTYVDDPVATFDTTTLPDWSSRYGTAIHSASALHTLLTDSYDRVAAGSLDTTDPVSLDNALLTQSENVHAALDSWTPPPGVQLIQIAGWGIPTTLSGISYTKGSPLCLPSGLCTPAKPISFSARTTVDGDGTVTVPSALWVSTTTGAVDYWVDLGGYNNDNSVSTGFGILAIKHPRILEIQGLRDLISDQLTGVTKSISNYSYLSIEAPFNPHARLRYSLHSPLTLNLYDDQGRHTGVSTTTGQIEEQIPGTYYSEFGDVKYIFTDTSSAAHIIMNGYASGTFTFNVDQYMGNTLTASTTFKDIPSSTSTTAALSVQSDISTLSPMSVDKNGDGVVDATLAPRLNDIVTLDTTPPEFRIGFATSTNALGITATDDSGTTTISASTSYPILKKGQKDYKGIATTTVTARDAAGNSMLLIYTEQLPSPLQRDTILLQALVYNGATTTLASSSVSYKWRVNSDGSYKLLASFLRTIATTSESHFRPKKNTTIIMTKPVDLDDTDTDDDVDVRPTKTKVAGLVVPYMRTEKGSLIISY